MAQGLPGDEEETVLQALRSALRAKEKAFHRRKGRGRALGWREGKGEAELEFSGSDGGRVTWNWLPCLLQGFCFPFFPDFDFFSLSH